MDTGSFMADVSFFGQEKGRQIKAPHSCQKQMVDFFPKQKTWDMFLWPAVIYLSSWIGRGPKMPPGAVAVVVAAA